MRARAAHTLVGLLLAAFGATAAPPQLDIPAEIKAQGDYVTLSPKTDAKAVTYVALSGVEPFPNAFLKDPRTFVLPVRGLPAGTYRFAAVGSLNDEQAKVEFAVVVPGPPGPPPEPPPVPDDGKKPPQPKPGAKTFWVVVVEAEAGPDADAAALLNDRAAWADLAARGHSFRQYRPGSKEAAEKGYLAQVKARGVELPALVLVEREPGKPPAAVVPLPKDKAGVDAVVRQAGGK